jgi:tetratricopeptide (TPR) repeat protein
MSREAAKKLLETELRQAGELVDKLPILQKHCQWIIATIILVFAAYPTAAHALSDSWTQCVNAGGRFSSEQRIAGCTAVIGSREENQNSLAIAYNNRALVFQSLRQYDRAILDYDQAIRFMPTFAHAFGNRASAYYLKGDYDRAVADYSNAIRLDPTDARDYVSRGTIHHLKAEYEQAIADFTQAIAIDPNYANAYRDRGSVYQSEGDVDRARADFDRAVDLNLKLNERCGIIGESHALASLRSTKCK